MIHHSQNEITEQLLDEGTFAGSPDYVGLLNKVGAAFLLLRYTWAATVRSIVIPVPRGTMRVAPITSG